LGAARQLDGKRPNGIPDTGAADKEQKYESKTRTKPLGGRRFACLSISLCANPGCRCVIFAFRRTASSVVLPSLTLLNSLGLLVVLTAQVLINEGVVPFLSTHGNLTRITRRITDGYGKILKTARQV
jgi:hypothetical protein